MTESQKKFQATYGDAKPSTPASTQPAPDKAPPASNSLHTWGRRLIGIVSLILLGAGLFFGLAIFLIVGGLILLGTFISSLLRGGSGSSSQHLTR